MLPLRADAPPVYVAAAPFIEGEVFVRSQVVDSKLFCPRFLGGWFAVEEEDVGLSASPARTALGVGPEFAGSKERDGKAEGLSERERTNQDAGR